MSFEQDAIEKLDQLIAAIKTYPDPRRASDEWKQVYRILQKANFPAGQLAGIVGMRDLARLTQAIDQLRPTPADASAAPAGAVPADSASSADAAGSATAPAGPGASGGAPTGAPAAASPAVPADTLRRAMKAFKKRSALMRLEEESKIGGHGPLTKGVDGRFAAAIIPPDEWPAAVWQELVRQGRLKYLGHGFYELA